MKKSILTFLLLSVSVFTTSVLYSQGPGCPNVNAGADATVDCTNTCVDLTASYLQTGETDIYGVTSIPYAPPFSFTGLANPISVNTDDVWSSVINLPFDFCFFGDDYNQIQVGSNGVVRFDVDPADTSNGWSFIENIPNNANPTLGEANIFGVCHDMDPSLGASNPEIAWDITGTAPCRTFVVSFSSVSHFSCTNLTSTSMIVLYETTNAIEVYVQDKPTCTTWNSGNAVLGIQNNDGTVAYVPPGRNTSNSPWTAFNEAWRFTPDGARNYVFNWYDDTGTSIGTANTINVCPSTDTVYTAEVVYTNCNGDVITVTDDVLVTASVPFTVDIGPDQDLCEGDPDILLNGDIGSVTATYQWALNGTDIVGATNPTLFVSSPNSGMYTVTVNDQGCDVTDDVEITYYTVPTINPVSDYLLCDDSIVDGFTEFDLSTKDAEVIGAQVDVIVSYHFSLADANNNVNSLPNLYTNVLNPQTIYARLMNINNPDCYVIMTFDLFVSSGITANQPPDFIVCDDPNNDGIESFDLDSQTAIILGGQTGVTVSYHISQTDADSNVNPLASPYNNTSSPQTIFVRVQDDINNTCFESTTFNLVVSELPIANQPPDLVVCDDSSNDGIEQFDLNAQTTTVLGAQLPADFTVTYHNSQPDADSNSNAISSPYTNVTSTETIFVRIENNSNTDCYDSTSFTITVNPSPTATTPMNFELCDDISNDGTEVFDLNSQTSTIIGAQVGVSITYYETQVDADNNTNPILNPGTYLNTSSPQTIYSNVVDNNSGCSNSSVSFDLIVNPMPSLNAPTVLEVCDDSVADGFTQIDLSIKNSEISGGNSNYSISYHLTIADANSGNNALSIPYTNISNPQTIFVRGEDINTGCFMTVTLDLIVEQAPIANTPPPMTFCDDDNDGFGEFVLTNSDVIITGGDPTLTVSFHETLADANNNVNFLSSPYSNIVAYNQTLYARVESATIATDCETIVELDLIVYNSPVIPNTIPDLEVCDDTTADGITQIDLTLNESQILGSQSPTDFILSYHTTQIDAEMSINPIVNETNYTNLSNPQTIFVSLQSVTNGCITTGSFNVLVNPLPVIATPSPLELCDDDFYGSMDGFLEFDLTLKDNEITIGDGSLVVSYFETNAEAQSNTNQINPATAYTNTTNPQTIFVRVTNGDTGCFSFTTLTLRVQPNPTPQTPMPIVLCDDVNPGDNVETFDLTIREADIINGELGVTATYHETQSDAELGLNLIPDPTLYTSTTNNQTIFVRVTNDTSGCYTIVELILQVNPLPSAIALTNLITCELNNDGFYDFDLDSKTSEVLNGQDSSIFAVTYHETLSDAQSGINALISPYTNITNPQQIFVNVTNTTTGCDISNMSFNIEVQEAAQANMPANTYVICDNLGDNDGFGQFDLSTQDLEILGTQNPANYTVSYYETAIDADLGVNSLPTIYENVSNPQVIYVRVDNNSTICYETTSLTIEVELLPIFDIDDNYVLCADSPGGVLTSVAPPLIDTGLDSTDYIFEWTDQSGVVVGTDSIFTPSTAGNYFVTATNITTGCQNSDSTVVEQSSPPDVQAEVTTLAFADVHVIEATATGEGVYEFSLDGGPWQESGTFTDVSLGEHVVTARDLNGCGESSATVMIMDYPLYFTPNGDGYNDTWNIVGISNQIDATIYIFDRYGKLLKQLSPTSIGWDGNFNGAALPSSDYWFTVEYREPSDGTEKEFKAHFTLKR